MFDTRVTLDSIVGPYDCKGTGWSYRFSLDATRQVSAGTLEMADSYGFSCVETIHVIDGHEGAPDTVHIIDSGETFELNEDGDRAARAVAVRVRWRGKTPTATPIPVTPQARRAARKTKNRTGGRGAAARAVVVCVRWQWVDDEGSGALDVIQPVDDGHYPIGGGEWPWCVVTWACVCGDTQDWHESDCLCGLTRDAQPRTLLAKATAEVGRVLRDQEYEATSALVDLTGLPRVQTVLAGEREIDMADDTGPFDTETLGEADEVLRQALGEDDDLTAAGWEPVPDEESTALYRITFPAIRTH
ncbi:hypothetical protein [Streptomyces sp. Root369]|uniref:hypothetical protein n=1 Tax=Streptomyces sp. Root369 TaxID=1736523 RepID=UPI000710B3C3|nr:hypothetical protein [Streptomyces sp. Root369]KQW13540.1 hypothetical protein ASD08_30705 [Streptomyces sp. Root369]